MQVAWQRGGKIDREVDVFVGGDLSEGSFDLIAHIAELHHAYIHAHGARLDLGQIQDVVDQRKEIGAGRIDGGGEINLLGRQVAVRIFRQQLGQDQQTVERRAQLVRHVGQELGLVLGRQSQLLGLFFQRLPGPVDLAILALDLGVLRRQQFGLFFQLLVGLLQLLALLLEQLFRSLQRASLLLQPLVGLGQLALLTLQLFCQRLRLLEQLFLPHPGLDRV